MSGGSSFLAAPATRASWTKALLAAGALHIAIAASFMASRWLEPASADEFGAETVIEFAPVVSEAASEFAPEAAQSDAEDRQAAPMMEEALSKTRQDDAPTEQSSPETPDDPDLRMAQERTLKERADAAEMQQTSEAMAQQEASQSSQASLAAEATPDRTGAVEAAKAPDEGNSAAAKRRLEAWQRQIFAHIVKFKKYPEDGRAKHLTGETLLAFSLASDGAVSNIRVAKSSSHALLDRAAIAVLERASPLPKPPAGLKDTALDLALPMRFTLK